MLKRMQRSDDSRLRFETLENRMMLAAGVIQIKVSHQTLYIKGTDLNDTIVVSQGTAANSFDVVAYTGDVTPPAAVTYSNIKNIKIESKGGDDNIAVGGLTTAPTSVPGATVDGTPAFVPTLTLLGELKIDGGRGSDTITVGESSIGGNAEIKGGQGSEFLTVSTTKFGKNLKVDSGADNDVVTVSGVAVARNATIKTGSGDDFASVIGLTVGNKLEVSMGKGHDQFFSLLGTVGPTIAADLIPALTTFLTNNEAGFATLLASTTIPTLTTDVQDLLTATAALVPNSITAREASFKFGSGNDTAVVDETNISGQWKVEMGAGTDALTFTGNVAGRVSLDGGSGADTLDLGTNTGVTFKKIKHFETINSI